MSDVVIRGPVGGTGAHVDTNQHLHVDSVQRSESDRAARLGFRFNINTGDITLTNATLTSVAYVKNTGDDDLIIASLVYNLGATASGSGDAKIEVIRNPTAGGIITNANDMEVGPGVSANMNFGSTNTMTGLFYKGATGETAFTDGDVTISTRSASNTGRIVVSLGAMDLPKGTAIGINYTPPTSNTSQIVQFAMSCHIRTELVASSETSA
jgi:hypothetical protein